MHLWIKGDSKTVIQWLSNSHSSTTSDILLLKDIYAWKSFVAALIFIVRKENRKAADWLASMALQDSFCIPSHYNQPQALASITAADA